ncbi:osmoprotectant ABC transporter substrate-binding protein [Streptococcus ferus]|uniref:osmoprotectant ABC transporter substrate-binding protein n=1 Tax=Streptococcus ferus TaxID=1345 RepID=UPI003519C24E
MKKKIYWLMLSAVLSLLTLSGCNLLQSNQFSTIKIASMNTTESSIMANMIAELIEHETSYKTTLISNLGSSSVAHQALLRKDADIAATRYTGTDITGTLGLKAVKDPTKAAEIVKKEFSERFDQTWFPSYGFSDTYAFMVTSDFAEQNKIKTISDLGQYAQTVKAGVDSTWMNRQGDGYSDFTKTYGFAFKNIYPMQIGLVYDAVASDKMQVVLGYSTDGRIPSYDLTLLEDDKQFFPPYEASMVVNNSLLKKYPKLKKLLHRLDGKISLQTMQRLNYQVDDTLLEPSVVAKQFLKENHYFREEDEQ